VHLDVRPLPEFTIWETVYRRLVVGDRVFFNAQVQVRPRDRFGNVYLVDPELDTTGLELIASGGRFAGPVVGNLDGSYSRTLRFAGDEKPVVTLRLADRELLARRPVLSPAGLTFANAVLTAKLGREAKEGLNRHREPKAALGEIATREPGEFFSLGGFGTVTLGVEGQVIVGGAADDVTVFVQPDEELRPYRVDVLAGGQRPRWVLLGESPGVTQSFSLAAAKIKSASAVRISDLSGRTRTNELDPSASPGMSLLGVGFRKTAKATPTRLERARQLIDAPSE
jgi:hypothetical protein